MSTPSPTSHEPGSGVSPWWLVLCLVGLDYFSSLAYLPSLAVQAVGPLAPVAALIVALVTLGVALPVYSYVVGRSPDGRGGTGVIERLVPGWRGKLLILLILSFVATDYVVTQSLSIADAAEHLRANPGFEQTVLPFLERCLHPESLADNPTWQRWSSAMTPQLLLTLVLTLVCFALWGYWRSGSTRRFLHAAAIVVAGYMVLNAIVIASGLRYLAGEGQPLVERWRQAVLADATGSRLPVAGTMSIAFALFCAGLAAFPFAALGLSGFELSMAVCPMIRGDAADRPESPRGRIRNMRKLLAAAAILMCVWLCGAVFVAATLIPADTFRNHGPAVHRALAYLAHGGTLADGRPGTDLSPLFGAAFGGLYDVFTIAILCMAGACVLIALRDYVPDYLQRFGMELELAHRLGVKLRFFNVIVLVITVLFCADIARLKWAYVTSVLVLLAGGSLAALMAVRSERQRPWARVALRGFSIAAFSFFVGMALLSFGISLSGLEIAVAFGLGILATSVVSRWVRSTELRFEGFDFADGDSRHRWDECCAYEFQILVPHRPGMHSRLEKSKQIRERHRLGPDTPIILIEAELGDPSEFLQRPLLTVIDDDGTKLIRASRCASVAHVLAAIALEMSRVGRPCELHFGWSHESPLSANLNFLLFGEGNIPWLVRELLLKAEPDAAKRPHVILG